MKVLVIGAGAWGLSAAAEVARRGHRVTVLDRYGAGNLMSSSSGPTRLWRLGDPDPLRVRLAMRAVEARKRLEKRADRSLHRRLGLLWRDTVSLPPLLRAVSDAGVAHELVPADRVGERLPGLRPDDRLAVWLPDAGTIFSTAMIRAQRDQLHRHGGSIVTGPVVIGIDQGHRGVQVRTDDGSTFRADIAVVAPGPGAVQLLPALGIDVPVQPFLEQVVHFGDPHGTGGEYDAVPCLFDGGTEDDPAGIYAMPTPAVGYKVGLDIPLRRYDATDIDREPSAERTRRIASRVRQDLGFVPPVVLDAQLCSWTDSPDGRFIVDRLDNVVVACGDSGEGFKFSPLMGEMVADLCEGEKPDTDVAALSLNRFADRTVSGSWTPTSLGRA